jgi:Tfp pilus assembly protein PilX
VIHPSRRQGGVTLLITLVMLVIMTLFAVSAFDTSNTNLTMSANLQTRQEALGAAMRTIDETVSHTDFTKTPANAIPVPCGAGPNTLCTDLNSDGTPELTTTLTPNPFCNQGRVIKVPELNFTLSQDDLACVQAQQQGTFAVAGATPTGDSLCGKTIWEIRAQTLDYGATPATSNVNTAVVQGVGLRMPALDIPTSCP